MLRNCVAAGFILGTMWSATACGGEPSAVAESAGAPRPIKASRVPAMTCDTVTTVHDLYEANATVGGDSPDQVMSSWASESVEIVLRKNSEWSFSGYVVDDDDGTVVSASIGKLPKGGWVAHETSRCAD